MHSTIDVTMRLPALRVAVVNGRDRVGCAVLTSCSPGMKPMRSAQATLAKPRGFVASSGRRRGKTWPDAIAQPRIAYRPYRPNGIKSVAPLAGAVSDFHKVVAPRTRMIGTLADAGLTT
ncbi:hypothetical protein WS68_15620 [Burkholderia sp. TSV86]|nr:hypothetical protein WS68_15620 [Burkholderia sp. TSV86]